MKTAVSIPDDVIDAAERLARKMKKSRSRLLTDALKEYMARHSSDDVTAALDRVYEKMETSSDPFVQAAARQILKSTEW